MIRFAGIADQFMKPSAKFRCKQKQERPPTDLLAVCVVAPGCIRTTRAMCNSCETELSWPLHLTTERATQCRKMLLYSWTPRTWDSRSVGGLWGSWLAGGGLLVSCICPPLTWPSSDSVSTPCCSYCSQAAPCYAVTALPIWDGNSQGFCLKTDRHQCRLYCLL